MAAKRRSRLFFNRCNPFVLALVAGAVLNACVGTTNPVTGEQDWTTVDEQQELEIGKQTHEWLLSQYGYYENPQIQEYVTRVGLTLVPGSHRPDLPYVFTVLDSDIVNAFATPGYVYISRGMLALLNSEAELAGVLGHELAHITARHTAQQIGQRQTVELLKLVLSHTVQSGVANQVAGILGEAHVRGYGREHELEADRLGAEYAARAGYDPEALLQVIRIIKDQEAFEARLAVREGRRPRVSHWLFSTHPDNDTRKQEIIRAARKHQTAGTGLIRRAEYLEHIDGMEIGQSEAQGFVKDHRFYHKPLAITMKLPEDWPVHNQPTHLAAYAPDRSTEMRLYIIEHIEAQDACEFLKQEFAQVSQLRRRMTKGYEGCRAWVRGANFERADVTALQHSPNLFLVTATQALKSGGVRRHAAAIEATVNSLRPMTAAEDEAVRSARMEIITAKPGDTYAAYAQDAWWSTYPQDQLRLFNGVWPKGEPEAGETVKVVR